MKTIKRFYKNNTASENFEILFDDGKYCIVKNCKEKDYSFGLWRDFYDLYFFPMNQSCLTLKEIKERLHQFIGIDKKYWKTKEEQDRFSKINLYNAMLDALKNEI